MHGRTHRHDGEELPLAPLAWTRRRLLGTGLAAAGGLALGRIEAVTAGPRPAQAELPPGVDREIADLMALGRLPGLSAAVVRADGVVWARGYGSANLWRREPVRQHTLFMLASISKTVVATAVMQAVERALFGLDDDVNEILPFPRCARRSTRDGPSPCGTS